MLMEDISNYTNQLNNVAEDYNEELFGIIEDMNSMPSVPQPSDFPAYADLPRKMPTPKKYESPKRYESPKKYDSSSSDTSIEEIRARAESIRKQFS